MPDEADIEFYALRAARERKIAATSPPGIAEIHLAMATAFDTLSTCVDDLLRRR